MNPKPHRLLEDGQKIGRKYEVERFLGEGAFAEVYRVRHHLLGRRQAMKVFKHVRTEGATEDILAEAQMLSSLGHPNIIRVFDADIVETRNGPSGCFTMEYVAGGALQDFWASHRRRFVPVDVTVRILAQICQGLSLAHSENPPIVHRDITPRNILVGYDDTGVCARISDFGLAKRVDPLTWLVSTKGTLAFKAPESLLDPRNDSRAGDVWAIGAVAYLLLTDSLPYEDSAGPASFFGTQYLTAPRPPQEMNPAVDERLAEIVLRALEPDPHQRLPHAGALAEEFMRWQESPPPHPEPKDQPAERPATQTSKLVLGTPPPSDTVEGHRLAGQALELARQASALTEAADLMEEAFNKDADLRSKYEDRLTLWRKGVAA